MGKAKLQNKIMLLFVGLLLTTQVVTFFTVTDATWEFTQDELKAQIHQSKDVLTNVLAKKEASILQAGILIAENAPLKQSVVKKDSASLNTRLAALIGHIKADTALIISLDNRVLASTLNPLPVASPFPHPQFIQAAESTGHAQDILLIEGHAYLMIAVPILRPLPIAWLVLGIHVDDNFAQDIASLTQFETVFIHSQDPPIVLASSLPVHLQASFATRLSHMTFSPQQVTSMFIENKPYQGIQTPISRYGEPGIEAMLIRGMTKPIETMRHLKTHIFWPSLFVFLAGFLGTILLARGVTKPLRALTQTIYDITNGAQLKPLDVASTDEIGELAKAFNHMQESIKRREEEISYRAFNDALTGLPNRVQFIEMLETELREANKNHTRVAVLIMDVNRFKDINDTLGHHAGDTVLKKIALRLKEAFVDAATVARLGGDEFALLITPCERKQAIEAAKHCNAALNKPMLVDNLNLEIHVSVGIALFPHHAKSAVDMLQRADIAMYESKESKSLYCLYSSDFDKHSKLRLSLMNELKAAVRNNELILHYQPKIDLAKQRVTDVEALVRWIHPKHGIISPMNFIPLAEQTGHIRYLTQWALHTAVKQCYEWQSANLPLKIAVNISAVDLLDTQLVTEIEQVLQKIPIEPSLLVLEVTESAIMNDPDRAVQILQHLNEMGIGLAIDDFGTGYSSMTQLKKLPVQELKIDKSFIDNMVNDKHDEIIVKSSIDLAHNMGLRVVCEGITDEESLKRVTELGSDIAQGHYLSPPLSITDLSQWLIQSPYGHITENP